MKKDIFHGKIKKEYFSYILFYLIFFFLLLFGFGAFALYDVIWGVGLSQSVRLFGGAFGAVLVLMAFTYLFLELLVIYKFPKYVKIRRILFNSDIYFTDSTSEEYYGSTRGLRRRRYKDAFDLVTTFAKVESAMGKKQPIKYKVYLSIVLIAGILGLISIIGLPLLYVNGVVFSNVPEGAFIFCCLLCSIICIAIAIFSLIRALNVAIMAPYESQKWKFELYSSLVDISVRKNNKKHKFWYNVDQLEQIENLVKSASENAELKLEKNEDKLVSFAVRDTLNERVEFEGLFI